MVFEDSHNFVLVEVGYPVEEGIEISCRIAIECLADRVDGDMIVDKLDFVAILFKRINHIIFLETK